MELSVYSYNSAFACGAKNLPQPLARCFPSLNTVGWSACRGRSRREGTAFFSPYKNKDVTETEEKWKANKQSYLTLSRAWGFLCRWHDNLSANGTARPIVSLIVCLRPLHAAAGMCNLGSNFWQIARWTRQSGGPERLILSVEARKRKQLSNTGKKLLFKKKKSLSDRVRYDVYLCRMIFWKVMYSLSKRINMLLIFWAKVIVNKGCWKIPNNL